MSSVLPPNSFYVVSYPRSGNTWLLNCLTMLLDGVQGEAYHPYALLTEKHGEPGDGFYFWCEPRTRAGQPICIKSHDDLDTFRRRHPPAPLVYIARDARDALLSYYFYLQAFPSPQVEQLSTQEVGGKHVRIYRGAHDPVFSAAEFSDFLRREAPLWAAHVASARNSADVCYLTYEDLTDEFEPTLRRVLDHLQLPLVQSYAETGKVYGAGFQAVFTGNNRDFFRRGQVGDWRNWFEPEHARLLDSLIGPALRELGFENNPEWARRYTPVRTTGKP
jgi:hypothetical protein